MEKFVEEGLWSWQVLVNISRPERIAVLQYESELSPSEVKQFSNLCFNGWKAVTVCITKSCIHDTFPLAICSHQSLSFTWVVFLQDSRGAERIQRNLCSDSIFLNGSFGSGHLMGTSVAVPALTNEQINTSDFQKNNATAPKHKSSINDYRKQSMWYFSLKGQHLCNHCGFLYCRIVIRNDLFCPHFSYGGVSFQAAQTRYKWSPRFKEL